MNYPSMLVSTPLQQMAERLDRPIADWIPTHPRGCFSGEHLPLIPVVSTAPSDTIQFFRWGFVPYWAKQPRQCFNEARSRLTVPIEKILDIPSYQAVIQLNRCLALVDGYIEPDQAEGNASYSYVQQADGQPMLLLGVWNECHHTGTPGEFGGVERTFSLLTKRMSVRVTGSPVAFRRVRRLPVAVTLQQGIRWISELKNEQSVRSLLQGETGYGSIPMTVESMTEAFIQKLVGTMGIMSSGAPKVNEVS